MEALGWAGIVLWEKEQNVPAGGLQDGWVGGGRTGGPLWDCWRGGELCGVMCAERAEGRSPAVVPSGWAALSSQCLSLQCHQHRS